MTPQINNKINRSIKRYWIGSNRRWEKYNESLVDRVEYLTDLSFIKDYDTLLEEKNSGKIGHPYKVPDALIMYLARLRSIFNVPFRSLEGILRSLAIITGIKSISYSEIFRRIRRIKPELNNINNKLDCIIDSTGYKITIRGDYLGHKWHKKRKGWLKLHVIISLKDVNVLSFTITDEHTHDSKAARKLLSKMKNNILRIFGDRGYDSKYIYNMFGYNAVIPPRKNASTKSRGSSTRAKIVRFIKKNSMEQWKENNSYGKRWIVEIYFSGLKRVMTEVIKAKKIEYIIQELALKVVNYNIMRGMTHAY
ncbi:transposase IS4 family protein [Ferroplasma acidiphilum]|uniref:Transposase, IS4 family protein n=2 Tax=Ferroplasma TaxID=74968 RepID=S0ATC9_FERAC|nr:MULTISPECIES: IS5-like element ISFac2 family transposase [Ferroplasma]AGO61335.1 transposase, IS4 family protein [Ferroplasma acidarmanus Fer1]ARD84021.1 transposase IS4 family protein [Ferroplasma acidiphilum]ARD84601.1 transposase IS4 family protein [Ferroplasma acidiphilum]ARD84634.1 transposase IS4 family protein [Ferroplasma acidiphilum]